MYNCRRTKIGLQTGPIGPVCKAIFVSTTVAIKASHFLFRFIAKFPIFYSTGMVPEQASPKQAPRIRRPDEEFLSRPPSVHVSDGRLPPPTVPPYPYMMPGVMMPQPSVMMTAPSSPVEMQMIQHQYFTFPTSSPTMQPMQPQYVTSAH